MLGIGVDVGYESCGAAVMDVYSQKVVDHLTIHTPRTKTLSERLCLVHQELSLLISRSHVVVVGFESPFKTGKAKQTQGKTNYNPLILCQVAGYVQSLGWERGLPVYANEPQDVKKAVLGPGGGTASKEEVRRAVLRITGLRLNEHEADAVATLFRTVRRWRIECRVMEAQA